MSIPQPAADPSILARREEIIAGLRACVADPEGVIADEDGCRAYETDGLSAYRQIPLGVVLPANTAEVSAVLKFCGEAGVNVVARGAGTSLAGGALPLADSVVVGVSKLNAIHEIDLENRVAVVGAGVTNLAISDAVDGRGYFYAPDPSSQLACTIAGNVAMNSGGAHCLKYGVTTNNVLGVKIVFMDGSVHEIGGKAPDAPGLDLLGLIIGSEGTIGVVTEVTVRLLHKAEGARPVLLGFNSNEDAGACVADIIRRGILPVAIEFMDKPAIKVCENFAKAGYPLDVEALLIIEVEGSDDEIDDALGRIEAVAEEHGLKYSRVAATATESELIWKGRKSAFGAMGQIADYICMDGTIPTSTLPQVLRGIAALGEQYGFTVANIFHAGDGNLHPLILYNANQPGELDQVEAMGAEVLKLCVDVGGCLTGEHGVGVEKRDLMDLQFSETDLAQQKRLKSAFDPHWRMNPHKVFPLVDGKVQQC